MMTSYAVEEGPVLENTITYRSFKRFFFNVLAVCCGSFFFGYTLSYFSIFPIEQIRT